MSSKFLYAFAGLLVSGIVGILINLRAYSHVKVVLAGSSLPEVHPSYANACDPLKLCAIEDDQAYITYYEAIKATLKVPLEDRLIPDIARLCGYIPGLFADFVAGRYGSG